MKNCQIHFKAKLTSPPWYNPLFLMMVIMMMRMRMMMIRILMMVMMRMMMMMKNPPWYNPLFLMGEHTGQHARGLFLTDCWPETDWIVLIFQNLLHNMSDNLDVRNFCPPTLRVIQSPPPALAILQSWPLYALKRFELFIAVTLASLVSLFQV